MAPTPPKTRDGFEIAIVCALPLEADAVEALMEDFQEPRPIYDKAYGDRNVYTTGWLGVLPIVLVRLRGSNNLNAATVSSELRYSFRNIRLALVVGIAGGVPQTPKGVDILIGDVLISTLVIQHDTGKQYSDELSRQNEPESTLSRATPEIANFIAKLQGARVIRKLAAALNTVSGRPEPDEDRLFPAKYRHKHRGSTRCRTCNKCERSDDPVCDATKDATCEELGCEREVSSQRRADTIPDAQDTNAQSSSNRPPAVHFGRIASGNVVMRSGLHRDRVARRDGVIGFEMEGAGTWDQLPTVIVKGVSDYSDSHKNDNFQKHAADIAAACAKTMLTEWDVADPPNVVSEPSSTANNRCILPRRPRPRYFGYTRTLQRLEERLSPSNHSGTYRSQVVFALVGMGGVGKSETALQFAHKFRRSYWGVFWVDCSSDNKAQADFQRIAGACAWPPGDNEQGVDAVKQRLSAEDNDVLLVLDNCDNANIDYEQYVPTGDRVGVIITTRLHDWTGCVTYGENDMKDVEFLLGLDEQSALDLVFQTCDIQASDRNDKRLAAMRLAEAVGHHPLAIISGSSFVKQRQCSLEEYPEIFQERKEQMLRYGSKQMQSRYENVFATFEVSAEYLSGYPDPAMQHALHLLEVLVFMDRENIGDDIFIRAWKYQESLGQQRKEDDDDIRHLSDWHVRRSQAFLGTETLSKRYYKLTDARSWLCGLSLARLDDNATCTSFSVHPLVYDWARMRIKSDRIHEAWTTTASILALSTTESNLNWPWSRTLQKHIHACVAQLTKLSESFVEHEPLQTCKLLFALYRQSHKRAVHASMGPIVQIMKEKSRLVLPGDQNVRKKARMHRIISASFVTESEYPEAESLLREAIHRLEGSVSPDDPELFQCQVALMVTLLQSGQPAKALEMQQPLLKHLGSLTISRHNRVTFQFVSARAFRKIGRLPEAARLLERIAPTNRSRLDIQRELASVYQDMDEPAKSVAILELVAQETEALPKGHPERLFSQEELAEAYRYNDQEAQAIEILEPVVKYREAWPQSDPRRLFSQEQLAHSYLEIPNPKPAKAVVLFEQAVAAIKAKQPQANDPDLLLMEQALGWAHWEDDQSEKAIEILEWVLMLRAELFDNDELVDLGLIYRESGNNAKAVETLERVVDATKSAPANDSAWIQSRMFLTLLYDEGGQYFEADNVWRVACRAWQKLPRNEPGRKKFQETLRIAMVRMAELSKYRITRGNSGSVATASRMAALQTAQHNVMWRIHALSMLAGMPEPDADEASEYSALQRSWQRFIRQHPDPFIRASFGFGRSRAWLVGSENEKRVAGA